MSDKEVISTIANSFSWSDRALYLSVGMLMLGTMARTFISDEPFNARKFAGEMIFSGISGIVLWSFGVLQGFSTMETIFVGGLMSLGTVRAVEWLLKIAKIVTTVSGKK